MCFRNSIPPFGLLLLGREVLAEIDKLTSYLHHCLAMGADSFIVFYGIKFTLTDDEAEACEARSDGRMNRARKAKLNCSFDRLTDGEPHFLYVGASLAALGVEADPYTQISEAELHSLVAETRRKLLEAGFTEAPAFHFQLIAQY